MKRRDASKSFLVNKEMISMEMITYKVQRESQSRRGKEKLLLRKNPSLRK